MDASTIIIDPEIVKAKLSAYRGALDGRHSKAVEEEYEAAIRGFSELAKGTPLIDPFSAIRDAGWRSDGRPTLAMGRADQRQVHWSCENSRRYSWNEQTKTGKYYGSYAPMRWIFRSMQGRSSNQRAANLTVRIENVMLEPPVDPNRGVAMVPNGSA